MIDMQQLIDRLLANDLADLEGLEVKGVIPVTESLANEMVASYMEEFFTDPLPAAGNSATGSAYIKILKRLKPDLFKISFETGKAIVHFELKR